ncbi:MAG: DUF4132 domain-containing protein [Deltaproteobacteria bacterium]|nr:DUF4132 domain-containing protein [Deltaproteobacteria bacterium]
MTRELVFQEGSSHKFWRIELQGSTFRVTFGKVGTAGQTKDKSFPSEAEAKKAHDALVAEKLGKGYVETASGRPGGATAKPAAAAKPAATSKPAATPKAASSAKPAPAAATTAATAASTTATSAAAPMPAIAARPATSGGSAASADAAPMERSIALSDTDWRWATWRAIPPREAPRAADPFDLDACVERLARQVKPDKHGWYWDFPKAGLSPSMSREEARFWYEAMTTVVRGVLPAKRATQLAKESLPDVSVAAATKQVGKLEREPAPELALVLSRLFSPADVTEMLLTTRPRLDGYHAGGRFFHGYREHVFPYLSTSERAELAARIAPDVTPTNFPTDPYGNPPGAFLLAVLLGLSDALERVVASWSPDRYGKYDWDDSYHVPQVMIFGLGSAARVEEHMRRMRLRLRQPVYVRAWLAHTEHAALDYVAGSVAAAKNKDLAAELAQVLALVRSPEAAAAMLEVAVRSKAPKVAAAWLDANPEHTVAGLAPIAAGRGALASAASERLADMAKTGHAAVIAANAAVAAASAVKTVAAVTSPTADLPELDAPPRALAEALAKARSLKVPGWVEPAVLPPVVVEGRRLAEADVRALIGALAASTLEEPHPLVRQVAALATPPSRDRFAWRLFTAWLAEGAPSKERWALCALGHLGSDESALELAPMIRAWPGESQHQRAVLGLDVLATLGSDVALVQLSGIAQKVPFQALKKRAGECMERIAAARGLTRDELEDRVVPDGGFDATGKRTLSFGKRSFEVVLGPEGVPMVRDADGTRRADLPKPNAKDDAAVAASAVAEWKTLKKALRETVKVQYERLEQAMVTGRAWRPDTFDAVVARHPLMRHLAATLVWSAWKDGKLLQTFRLAEDGTLADAKDDRCVLRPDATEVRIAHPLDLDDATKAAWGGVLGDYEILAAFPQLGRTVFALTDDERRGDDLVARFAGREWGVGAFVGHMRRRGWTHGAPQDGGHVSDHTKAFPFAGVTAVLEHNGYPIGALEYADPQRIEHVYFVRGDADTWKSRQSRVKLAAVDPKVVSEVVFDLTG